MGAKFMLMNKVNVNGPDAHPVYRYLKKITDQNPVNWNFNKYLCDKNGACQHYEASTTPLSLEPEIQSKLKE